MNIIRIKDFLVKVSVPSRGLSYLTRGQGKQLDSGKCCRPLTGTLLSKCSILNSQLPLMRVSVPSRGLSYLNEVGKVYGEDAVKCFRPLTGTLLSKLVQQVLIYGKD